MKALLLAKPLETCRSKLRETNERLAECDWKPDPDVLAKATYHGPQYAGM